MQPVIVDNLRISKENSISWLFDMMPYFQHNFSLHRQSSSLSCQHLGSLCRSDPFLPVMQNRTTTFLTNLLLHPISLKMERAISFYFWILIQEGAWSQCWLLSTCLCSVRVLHLQHGLKSTITRHTHRLRATERLTCFPERRRLRCLSAERLNKTVTLLSAQQIGFGSLTTHNQTEKHIFPSNR